MKRFTVKHKNFGWQIGGDIRVNVQGDCKHYNEAMEYFAAYENTGLTPEQVQVLKATQQNRRTQSGQPEVVHGRWIEHIDSYENYCECSVCHYIPDALLDETNYCPNCGAKMDGSEKGESD